METLNTSTFKEKVFNFETEKQWKFAGSLPTIVDFYADWCGPCRMLAPVLEEIAKEYEGKVQIYKVNTEVNPELSSLFRVRGIPALLFIPLNGKPSLSAGFMPKEALKEAIRDVLKVDGAKTEEAPKKARGGSCC
jgi:thioredoxin 1